MKNIKEANGKGLTGWLDGNVKKLRWYDISLIKLAVFFATLFLVTAWPDFGYVVFSIGWQWYLFLMVAVMIPLLKKMYFD